jgi:hypothetical protein
VPVWSRCGRAAVACSGELALPTLRAPEHEPLLRAVVDQVCPPPLRIGGKPDRLALLALRGQGDALHVSGF